MTPQPPNRLWLARRRRGLEQKQVAHLLCHQGITQLSHYEQGLRLPSLETALKLEIVYHVPLRLLFKELFDQLEDDVWQRISLNSRLHKIYGNRVARSGSDDDNSSSGGNSSAHGYCAFTELLAMPNASEADRARVRRHVTALAKRLACL